MPTRAVCPPPLLDRVPEMLDRQQVAREVTAGDRLVHWDARADNILLRDDQAVLLDWAWACRGAPWLDTLLLALDFRIQGGPDADAFLAGLAADPATYPGEHLASVVAPLPAWGTSAPVGRPPPGLPTIRTWQAHWGRGRPGLAGPGRLWG